MLGAKLAGFAPVWGVGAHAEKLGTAADPSKRGRHAGKPFRALAIRQRPYRHADKTGRPIRLFRPGLLRPLSIHGFYPGHPG